MYTSSHTREVSYKSTFYSGKNTIIMITTTMITFIIISVFVVAALRCLSAVDGTLKSNNLLIVVMVTVINGVVIIIFIFILIDSLSLSLL